MPIGPTGLTAVFEPASATGAMRLIYQDATNTPLFSSEIIPPIDLRIFTPPAPNSENTLIITPIAQVTLVPAPLNDPGIPGGYYLVDNASNPLLAIDIRGQVYRLDPSIQIEPGETLSALTLTVKSPTLGTLATLTYNVEFFFTAQ